MSLWKSLSIDLPSQSRQFTNTSSGARKRHSCHGLSKTMSAAYDSNADHDGDGAEKCNVSTTQKVLKVTHKGYNRGGGESIGHRKPACSGDRIEVSLNVAQTASDEEKQDLRS